MRMQKFSILTVAAALLLLAVPSGVAKRPGDLNLDDPTTLSAKYRLADGGYLVFAVAEDGRAEGYYFREGRFGQLFGKVADGVLQGYWAEADNPAECTTQKRGTSSWGRIELNFDEPGEFTGLLGACEQEPDQLIGGRQ
jgi:hypothetical protein